VVAAAILARTPIAYWKLDETSGVVAADSSGNGRNGAYSGVTLGSTFAPFTAPTFGGGGTVDVYSASLNGAFGKDVGTALAFFRPVAGIGEAPAGLTIGTTTGPRLVQLGYGNDGFDANQHSGSRRVASNQRALSSPATSPFAAWGMVALAWTTASGGALILYSNGVASGPATGLSAWGATALASSLCFIGGGDEAAQIAHVALFPTVLSAADIAAIYAASGL